jgi:hypothetical protein
LFDVLYDDGTTEKGVERKRIYLDEKKMMILPTVRMDERLTGHILRSHVAAVVRRKNESKMNYKTKILKQLDKYYEV